MLFIHAFFRSSTNGREIIFIIHTVGIIIITMIIVGVCGFDG